jgi:hypothetical protein
MRLFRIKLATLFATAALASVTGCSSEDAPLPGAENLVYNAELTTAFRGLLDLRDTDSRRLDLRRVVLSCDSVPGKVHLSISFKDSSKALPAPLVSDTPCSETGVLVLAQARESRGVYKGEARSFTVYSKQQYTASMVKSEWQKVLNAALGTFAYSEPASEAFNATYAAALSQVDIGRMRFKCDTTTKTITYSVNYQQAWREGATAVACPPADADKSELLANIETTYPPAPAAQSNTYRVYAADSLSSASLAKLVEGVLQVVQPRSSF